MTPETPKGVSSRLLSMKFMQRAVNSNASTPENDAPSSKKRKTFHSPAQAQVDASINHASIKAALDERDAARTAALQQHSTTDLHWVLKDPLGKSQPKPIKSSLNIVYVGYGDIDSSDEEEVSALKGRTSSKTKTEENVEDQDNSRESSTSESDTDHHSPHDNKLSRKRSRSDSRNRQSSENVRAKAFRDKRKKKEVKLNKLTTLPPRGGISTGGGISSGGANLCHHCKQPGHILASCPQRGRGKGPKKP